MPKTNTSSPVHITDCGFPTSHCTTQYHTLNTLYVYSVTAALTLDQEKQLLESNDWVSGTKSLICCLGPAGGRGCNSRFQTTQRQPKENHKYSPTLNTRECQDGGWKEKLTLHLTNSVFFLLLVKELLATKCTVWTHP